MLSFIQPTAHELIGLADVFRIYQNEKSSMWGGGGGWGILERKYP